MRPPQRADIPRNAFGGTFEIFKVALVLGLTSFGGPVAHLGYFERAYVRRLGWLSAEAFASILALCQVTPGPTSSQAGFLIGLRRGGWSGAIAAAVGFTLPSAVLMFAAAQAAPRLSSPQAAEVLHGLRIAAFAVVAQAVLSLSRSLCPDAARRSIAAAAAPLLLLFPTPLAQIAVLLGGGLVGSAALGSTAPAPPVSELGISRRASVLAAACFAGVLAFAALARFAPEGSFLRFGGTLAATGSLVFGGGHVVLALLHDALVPAGWLSEQSFLAGYGAAQGVPGPLFSFAAYLGAAAAPRGSALAWSLGALVLLFIPGLLAAVAAPLLLALIERRRRAAGALRGVNAAVVGVLAAALLGPVLLGAVGGPLDAAVALAGLLALTRTRAPPLLVVAGCVLAALAEGAAGLS